MTKNGPSPGRSFGAIRFDVPPPWLEEILVVARDTPGSQTFVLCVSRIELAGTETMASLASRRLVEVVQEHPRAELVHATDTRVLGRAAIQNDFRWRTGIGEYTAKHCFIAGPQSRVFAVTGTAGPGRGRELDRRFAALLASLEFEPSV